MVLTESEWAAADPTPDVCTRVQEVLVEATRAYCVEAFFRDAGPEGPDEFEPLSTLLDALDWQVSKQRSEVLVEMALETLVADGAAEKRVRQEDGDSVAYYRAI